MAWPPQFVTFSAMTLLDQISEALGASGALGALSNTLGSSAAETDSLVQAGLPAILGGLGAQSGGDGANALFGMLGDGGGFADNLGSFFGQGDKTGLASKLVGSIFGSQRGAIESLVGTNSGSPLSMVSKFLPMVTPAVLGLLGKIAGDDGLDADGLSEGLAAIGADGPLGDILAGSTDEDRAGFVEGLGAFQEAGSFGALLPTASTAPVAVAGTGAVTAAGATAAGAAVVQRRGLAWLLPVLMPLLALIAGLVLWQCTSAATNDPEPVAVATEPEPEPTAVPEPEPTPEPAPEPTATPEPEPTPEPAPPPPPAVTIADLAAGTPELSTLLGIAGDLGLAGALGDADAGPFTVFAPTNTAFDGAEPVLSRLDGDQTETAVTYHVVPGRILAVDLTPGTTLETLAGETLTVGADGSLPGGVNVVTADIEADNGVVHILDGVLVPGSIQRSLATADINALFELEPIQFALSSADILPESVATLDKAVAFLANTEPGTRYEVQGHTDSQGGDEPNQILSEARANSVVAYLTANGIDADTLTAVGYGETVLKVDPELTQEDFAANRRIEFEDITP